jgi:hypothetical protein
MVNTGRFTGSMARIFSTGACEKTGRRWPQGEERRKINTMSGSCWEKLLGKVVEYVVGKSCWEKLLGKVVEKSCWEKLLGKVVGKSC